ncbi:MAG: CoB--CoM heterodisulfide reductase iron-sulfur subunit B family protein [Clostridia bacterium]|nr:CoB--CoM heterodisulfide reductase iron-sulfur subunit B family protein [Clostridia bacterium]
MRYAYYPGCSLHATGKEYDLSTRLVAKDLGVDLWELPDWTCCGSSAAHGTNAMLALALPARNLALAEKAGLDMAVPCAACYARLRNAELAVRKSLDLQEAIQDIIDMEYQATQEVYALLDIMANRVGLDLIKEKVKKPLYGLKVACYYGCLLVRPPEVGAFDDPEDPQSMDRLMEAIGAEAVPWAYKTECCGAGHSTTRTDIALKMLYDILRNAKLSGANCLATACPLCMLNLDMRQSAVEQKYGQQFRFPIFYFTELMGLALGHEPRELGIDKHFVDAMPLLGLIQAEPMVREESARGREEE